VRFSNIIEASLKLQQRDLSADHCFSLTGLTVANINYEEVEGPKGLIIIKAFAVPGGRLEPNVADLLIVLPPG